MEILILKPLDIGKIGQFSGMENDALMHHEGLNGWEGQHYLPCRLKVYFVSDNNVMFSQM